jgi:hypothetical protein
MRCWLIGGVMLGTVLWPSLDADEPPQPPDWVIAHNARRSLWSDPGLAELNLGVLVRDGEALIWGPVLNEQQAAEAVARLKLVSGVKLVINEMFVLPADDVLRRRLPAPSSRSIAGQSGAKPLMPASPTAGVRPIP